MLQLYQFNMMYLSPNGDWVSGIVLLADEMILKLP